MSSVNMNQLLWVMWLVSVISNRLRSCDPFPAITSHHVIMLAMQWKLLKVCPNTCNYSHATRWPFTGCLLSHKVTRGYQDSCYCCNSSEHCRKLYIWYCMCIEQFIHWTFWGVDSTSSNFPGQKYAIACNNVWPFW